MKKESFLTIKVESKMRDKVTKMARVERRTVAAQTAYLMELGIKAFETQGQGLTNPLYINDKSPVMEAGAVNGEQGL